MLSNDTLLQTSLVVASIIFTIFTVLSAIPVVGRGRIRRDMSILVRLTFVPWAVVSLISLIAISFLAILNSLLGLELLCLAMSVMLAVSVTIFIPVMGAYCVVLIMMLHPTP